MRGRGGGVDQVRFYIIKEITCDTANNIDRSTVCVYMQCVCVEERTYSYTTLKY